MWLNQGVPCHCTTVEQPNHATAPQWSSQHIGG